MLEHEWAANEFRNINLGDVRLNNRLTKITSQFFSASESSIPTACEGWTGAKACYRFFKNPKTDYVKILEAHRNKSLERSGDTETVLVIQDTTFINYANHHKTTGLGRIGKNVKEDSSGLIMHSALALDVNGIPIGLLDQKIYARPFLEGLRSRNRHKTPIEEKESNRWLESLRSSIRGAKNPSRFVTIADREADIYEFMLEIENNRSNFLIRAIRDRAINKRAKRAPSTGRIWEFMVSQDIIGHINVEVPQKNNGNKKRNAQLTVKVGTFSIHAPIRLRNEVLHNAAKPIKIYAVYVQELSPNLSLGEEPIEWMLLTNIPTINIEEALTRIQWYKFRWKIELFHKILKSGYNIEKCRLSDAERLKRYLTIMSIVAFRILFISVCQNKNDINIDKIFSKKEIIAIQLKGNLSKDKKLNVQDAIIIVARMGGFFGRKSDATPGFITIWRGLKKLNEIVATINIIKKGKTYGYF